MVDFELKVLSIFFQIRSTTRPCFSKAIGHVLMQIDNFKNELFKEKSYYK